MWIKQYWTALKCVSFFKTQLHKSEKSVWVSKYLLSSHHDKTDSCCQNSALFKANFSDKNRLAAFHSFMKKESCFAFWEMHESVVSSWPWFIFLLLPTDSCCQPTVANISLFIATFSMLGLKLIIIAVNQSWSQNTNIYTLIHPSHTMLLLDYHEKISLGKKVEFSLVFGVSLKIHSSLLVN